MRMSSSGSILNMVVPVCTATGISKGTVRQADICELCFSPPRNFTKLESVSCVFASTLGRPCSLRTRGMGGAQTSSANVLVLCRRCILTSSVGVQQLLCCRPDDRHVLRTLKPRQTNTKAPRRGASLSSCPLENCVSSIFSSGPRKQRGAAMIDTTFWQPPFCLPHHVSLAYRHCLCWIEVCCSPGERNFVQFHMLPGVLCAKHP